jgi:hypothetical protein
MELEAFELVLLRRPADASLYDEATLERIQSEHVAYHVALREAGRIVTNGPVTDQVDESLRGPSSTEPARFRPAVRASASETCLRLQRSPSDYVARLTHSYGA